MVITKIQEYKEITQEMIKCTEDEFRVNELLNKRQLIIDSITSQEDLKHFRFLYSEHKVYELDNKLKELLEKRLVDAKAEILEQRKKRVANSAYTKVNRSGVSLFSKQG